MTIAVDFDNTITDETPFPRTGNIRSNCYEVLNWLSSKGFKLYLYTCRKGVYLQEAIELIKKWKLPLEIPLKCNDELSLDKVLADFYIDDRNIGNFYQNIDWLKIKYFFEKNYIIN